ncbi:hypothetical protein GLOIN_2v1037402 [Rhizophagus clarus]|uniref:Uncharacterized protein n=1 Tax=Rhizophagus clarus TaxID=94130 RepID=A0A8H3KYZ4_9GLOM|nr:hypothetical protein GLOIN_2v1037402 [Rhizophagus clarus]
MFLNQLGKPNLGSLNNPEIITKSDQVSLQDSVQVNKATGTIEEGLQMASNSDNTLTVVQEEVDLMNFDDDWINFDNNNYDNDPIREVVQDVNVPVIDQLLCDLNFGKDYKNENETKNENVNNVQGNKMIRNEQVTSKHLEQEAPKKEINDKMTTQNKSNDIFNSMKGTPPSYPFYAEPINGTRPPQTNVMIAKQTVDFSRVKPVNGMHPAVVPCAHNMKETQTDMISSAMEMKRLVDKPRKKRMYSFIELLIYQFSPIAKELHTDINGRFSHYALDYDLINDNSQTENGQPRRPGVLRSTLYQQRNGWNRWNDQECVIAQNRWTALLQERELRTNCIKEFQDCKSISWINAHMNFTDKHSENCLVHHVIKDQKNEERYYEKNIRSEEKNAY